MLARFRDFLMRSQLLPEGARLLVGYSGGADSTCLLHMLSQLGWEIVAAHLHHGQRPEADQELKLCEGFAQELGVIFIAGRADVPRMAEELKIGLEEAGRNARYAFFEQAAAELQCTHILTAHTRDDHIETVLFNLVRGSGLTGLGGIRAQRDNIVRPLLGFSRQETRAYCEQHALWFHDDPSNDDLDFARVRIRRRVVPELRSLNEQADQSIVRLSETAAEEDRFLNGMAAAALEETEIRQNGDLYFLTQHVEAAFDRTRLCTLPPVLFKRAIRLAFSALGGQLSHERTAQLAQGLSSEERGSITAEGGQVVLEWDLEKISVRDLLPLTPYRDLLTLPGETISDSFGWQFTAFPANAVPGSRASLEVSLNPQKVKGQLYFRTSQPGDRLQPLGFEGHRKVSDLFGEAKLTKSARACLPIVCDLLGPIWVPGICIDERTRTEPGAECLQVSFGPLSED